MSRGVPDRVRWAMDMLKPAPYARVLEVGCGPGAAAELVCGQLNSGTMLAVDQSPVAVTRTRDRNAAHIQAGRLSVEQATLATLAVPVIPFDLIFTINVDVFWTSSADEEFRVLRKALSPGGRLAILYGPEPGQQDLTTDSSPSPHLLSVRKAVVSHGFGGVDVINQPRGAGVISG